MVYIKESEIILFSRTIFEDNDLLFSSGNSLINWPRKRENVVIINKMFHNDY